MSGSPAHHRAGEMENPIERGALYLGREIAAGRLDPVDLLEQVLDRVTGPSADHAFITVTRRRARDEARRSARRHRSAQAAGPLDGVPIGWKDLFDLAGTHTTAGSATREHAPAAVADAAAVRHATTAGLVCVGKTNLSEFAYSGLGLNRHFGTPRNPVVPGAIAGGSSAGSAVAVAAGALPCAIGTDTSGSVRVPASFCGLVGFKPTAARVDRAGVYPLAPTLDSVGPITRTVADAVAMDAVLRGRAPGPPAPSRGADVELVVPDGVLTSDVDPAVGEPFGRALERLGRAGMRVRREAVPELDAVRRTFDDHGTLVAAEAYRTHANLLAGDTDLVDPRVLDRLFRGRPTSEDGYATLLARRTALRLRVGRLLSGRVLVYPTVPVPVPAVATVESHPRAYAETERLVLRNTMITSYLDLPSISLPAGIDSSGRPVGLSVSGGPDTDDHVLAIATAIESALVC